jgi:hypothetical protein
LDQVIERQRSAIGKLTTNPTEVAVELAAAQDMTHEAIRRLTKACSGTASAEEKRTTSAANTDRPFEALK